MRIILEDTIVLFGLELILHVIITYCFDEVDFSPRVAEALKLKLGKRNKIRSEFAVCMCV